MLLQRKKKILDLEVLKWEVMERVRRKTEGKTGDCWIKLASFRVALALLYMDISDEKDKAFAPIAFLSLE